MIEGERVNRERVIGRERESQSGERIRGERESQSRER